MARQEIMPNWNRKQADAHNENYKEIYEGKFLPSKSIDSDKTTNNVMGATVSISTELPNYDSSTNILTFVNSKVDPNQSSIVYGVNKDTQRWLIPPNQQVVNNYYDTTSILIFKTLGRILKFEKWDYILSDDEILLGSVRKNGRMHSLSFNITVDNKLVLPEKSIPMESLENALLKHQVSIATTLPNYDTKTKILKFGNAPGLTFDSISYGNNKASNRYNIPHDLEVKNNYSDTTSILIFNTDTKMIELKKWDYVLNSNDLNLGVMRKNAEIIEFSFPILVDNSMSTIFEKSVKSFQISNNALGATMRLTAGIPNYSTDDSTLRFANVNNTQDTISFGNNKNKEIHLIERGLSVKNEYKNTSAIFIFNSDTKSFSFKAWNDSLSDEEILLGGIRNNGEMLNFNFPVSVDGKIFGKNSSDVIVDDSVIFLQHRGKSKDYPENTLIAYRASAKSGVKDVETDIAWTKDLVPVLLHDQTINRTGRNIDGTIIREEININNINYEELKKYEFGSWKSEVFKGEKIPTFKEFLTCCKTFDLVAHLDATFFTSQTAEKMNILKKVSDEVQYKNLIWNSMSDGHSELIRKYFPNAKILQLDYEELKKETVDRAFKYKTYSSDSAVICRASKITDEMINYAKQKNIKIGVWDADNLNIENLISRGINIISTDFMSKESLLDNIDK